jgi:hypothetical protein
MLSLMLVVKKPLPRRTKPATPSACGDSGPLKTPIPSRNQAKPAKSGDFSKKAWFEPSSSHNPGKVNIPTLSRNSAPKPFRYTGPECFLRLRGRL